MEVFHHEQAWVSPEGKTSLIAPVSGGSGVGPRFNTGAFIPSLALIAGSSFPTHKVPGTERLG